MSYRIEYDRDSRKYEVQNDHSERFFLFTMTAFVVFVLISFAFWPEGAAKLKSMLIPGEDAVTVQAFQTMTNDLRSGATVSEAVEAFCRFVIHGE